MLDSILDAHPDCTIARGMMPVRSVDAEGSSTGLLDFIGDLFDTVGIYSRGLVRLKADLPALLSATGPISRPLPPRPPTLGEPCLSGTVLPATDRRMMLRSPKLQQQPA